MVSLCPQATGDTALKTSGGSHSGVADGIEQHQRREKTDQAGGGLLGGGSDAVEYANAT